MLNDLWTKERADDHAARRANDERVFPHPRHLHFPACALVLPSASAPVSLWADKWGVDEVLRKEPCLKFARPDDVGDEEVIGAVITEGRDAGRRIMRVAQDQLVRLEQPGEHCWHLLAAIRGPRHPGDLCHVPRVTDRDSAEGLHPLGDGVHQRPLLVGVLVEQEVQLGEGRPTRISQWCFLYSA